MDNKIIINDSTFKKLSILKKQMGFENNDWNKLFNALIEEEKSDSEIIESIF